jgi:hypothetical protein
MGDWTSIKGLGVEHGDPMPCRDYVAEKTEKNNAYRAAHSEDNITGQATEEPLCSAEHNGALMLAPDLLTFIGVFALLEAGCREVWLTKRHQVVGIEPDDPPDRVDDFKRYCGDEMLRRFAYVGTAGDRNQHMMTGRVV